MAAPYSYVMMVVSLGMALTGLLALPLTPRVEKCWTDSWRNWTNKMSETGTGLVSSTNSKVYIHKQAIFEYTMITNSIIILVILPLRPPPPPPPLPPPPPPLPLSLSLLPPETRIANNSELMSDLIPRDWDDLIIFLCNKDPGSLYETLRKRRECVTFSTQTQ